MELTEKQFCQIVQGWDGELVDKIEQIALMSFNGEQLKEFIEHSIEFLNLESKQGVSDSPQENGALPLVRQRNANDKTDKSTSESEHGTLGKRTETKEGCQNCGRDIKVYPVRGQWWLCVCGHITKAT